MKLKISRDKIVFVLVMEGGIVSILVWFSQSKFYPPPMSMVSPMEDFYALVFGIVFLMCFSIVLYLVEFKKTDIEK